MEKRQGKATILKVDVPDNLVSSNEELNLNRARLSFRYVSNESDESNDAVMALLDELNTRNNEFSVLIELGNKKLSDIKTALENKVGLFTTYICPISEFNVKDENDKVITIVNNGERTYNSFNSSFIGKMDDENSVFQNLKTRFVRQLNEETIYAGEIQVEKKSNKRKFNV